MRQNRRAFYVFIFFLLSLSFVQAQGEDTKPKTPAFFLAPRADLSWYGRHEPTIGGGLCFGYDGSEFPAYGINASYIIPLGSKDEKRIDVIEVTLFIREYTKRWTGDPLAATGLFIQISGGALLFNFENELFKSFDTICASFGITLGWRIPFGARFYAEPAVRFGYPYGSAAELSLGVKF